MNKKGGISVILASIIVAFVLQLISLNIFISLLEINTVGNIRSILRTEVDTAVNNYKVDSAIYAFFNKDIYNHIPVLKDYSTIYTIYEYKNGSMNQISISYGDDNTDISLEKGQVLEITIRQNTISTLQKLNNMLTGKEEQGKIVISEKRAVN